MQQDHKPRHGPQQQQAPDITMALVASQATQISMVLVAARSSNTNMVSGD